MNIERRAQGQLYKYEQKLEDFPEISEPIDVESPFKTRQHNINIGRILSKYRPKHSSDYTPEESQHSFQAYSENNQQLEVNRTSLNKIGRNSVGQGNKDVGYIGRSGMRSFHKKNVHTGIALNYSQIYQDLKLDSKDVQSIAGYRKKIQRQETGQFGQANSNQEEQQKQQKRDRILSYDVFKKPMPSIKKPKNQDIDQHISSINFGSRKSHLPGLIMTNNTPKSQEKLANSQISIGYKPLFHRQALQGAQQKGRNKALSIKHQVSFNYKSKVPHKQSFFQERQYQTEQPYQQNFKIDALPSGRSRHTFDQNTTPENNIEKLVVAKYQRQEVADRENEEVKTKRKNQKSRVEQQTLGKSRSIGVGNYVIEYKDINQSYHSAANSFAKRSPREKSPIEQAPQKSNPLQKKTNLPQNPHQKPEIMLNDSERSKNSKMPGIIMNKSPRNQKKEQTVVESPEKSNNNIIIHYEKPQTIHNNSKLKDNNSRMMSTIKPQEQHDEEQQIQNIMQNQSKKEETKNNSVHHQEQHYTKVSHILEGIEDEVQNENEEEKRSKKVSIKENDLEEIMENKSNYLEEQELITNEKVIPEESPQEHHHETQLQFIHPYFDIEQYASIYPELKLIHDSLKESVINVQQVLKSIKQYLEIISSGNMDNLDEFVLPLNQKKSVKSALFYQRVVMILVGFAYVHGIIKEAHKFLVNAVGYIMSNCLIMLKVFEQVKHSTHPNDHHKNMSRVTGYGSRAETINQIIKKSDRVAMKRNLDTLRNNNDVIADTILKIAKHDETFLDTLKPILKQAQRETLQPSFYNLLEFFSFYLCNNALEDLLPFLSVCPNPYLPNFMPPQTKYTLIVDPVQLFCPGLAPNGHTSKLPKRQNKVFTNWQSFRPFKDHFLSEMQQYYEIIFWSNLFPKDVDKVISLLDTKSVNRYRLYRYHGIKKDKKTILKCVDRLSNLDPKTVIMLDDENSSGLGSLQNCIHVPDWRGNKNDTILAEICPLLAMVVIKRMDAMGAVRKVREQAGKNKREGVKYTNFGINFD